MESLAGYTASFLSPETRRWTECPPSSTVRPSSGYPVRLPPADNSGFANIFASRDKRFLHFLMGARDLELRKLLRDGVRRTEKNSCVSRLQHTCVIIRIARRDHLEVQVLQRFDSFCFAVIFAEAYNRRCDRYFPRRVRGRKGWGKPTASSKGLRTGKKCPIILSPEIQSLTRRENRRPHPAV